MSTTKETTAEVRELNADEYHANRTHDSNSTLRIFEQSPASYFHRFVTKRIPPEPATDAMRMGTAIHAAILEPERFDGIIALIPSELLSSNGSKAGNAYKEWKAGIGERVPLKREEYDCVRWQIETVWANPACRDLLIQVTAREHSIFWTDANGYKRRARLDAICELDAVVVDLKRTRHNAATFWKSVQTYGYANQAATYCDAARELYGSEHTFQFLLIFDAPPFESCVRVLPQWAIDIGRQQNADTLKRLYECKAGTRPWITEGSDVVSDLILPPWAITLREEKPEAENGRTEY